MKCKFPGCRNRAEKTWALVPLCEGHHETIEKETFSFYEGRKSTSEVEARPYYMQIARMVPWSKLNFNQLQIEDKNQIAKFSDPPKAEPKTRRKACSFCGKLFMLEYVIEHEKRCAEH